MSSRTSLSHTNKPPGHWIRTRTPISRHRISRTLSLHPGPYVALLRAFLIFFLRTVQIFLFITSTLRYPLVLRIDYVRRVRSLHPTP